MSPGLQRSLPLAWGSLGWMTAEGAVGLAAGLAAGSVALIGWALGSVIEGLASVIVIWRFTGTRALSETAERRAGRAVAVSFWLARRPGRRAGHRRLVGLGRPPVLARRELLLAPRAPDIPSARRG